MTFVSAISATISTAAATSPATCVRPPTASLIAVRESAPVTGKPPNRPQAILAAPKPISSRLASTRYRFFAPKLRAVTMPLPKLTTRMANALSARSSSSTPCGTGTLSCGRLAGISPISAMPIDCRSNSQERRMPIATARSGAGKRGDRPRNSRMSRNTPRPKQSVGT